MENEGHIYFTLGCINDADCMRGSDIYNFQTCRRYINPGSSHSVSDIPDAFNSSLNGCLCSNHYLTFNPSTLSSYNINNGYTVMCTYTDLGSQVVFGIFGLCLIISFLALFTSSRALLLLFHFSNSASNKCYYCCCCFNFLRQDIVAISRWSPKFTAIMSLCTLFFSIMLRMGSIILFYIDYLVFGENDNNNFANNPTIQDGRQVRKFELSTFILLRLSISLTMVALLHLSLSWIAISIVSDHLTIYRDRKPSQKMDNTATRKFILSMEAIITISTIISIIFAKEYVVDTVLIISLIATLITLIYASRRVSKAMKTIAAIQVSVAARRDSALRAAFLKLLANDVDRLSKKTILCLIVFIICFTTETILESFRMFVSSSTLNNPTVLTSVIYGLSITYLHFSLAIYLHYFVGDNESRPRQLTNSRSSDAE